MTTKNLGTLAVYLKGDKTHLDRTLQGASKNIHTFSENAQGAMGSIGKLKGFAVKAAGAMGLAFAFIDTIKGINKLKNEMDALGKVAANFGTTTGYFQELEYAAQRTGTSIEQVQAGFAKIKKLAGDAAAGQKEARNVFTSLGIDPDAVKKMNPEELFNSVNSAIMGLDEKMRSSVGAKIYGEQFEKMNNFLRDYSALGQEAKKRGLIISDEEIKAAEAMNDAILNLERTIRSLAANTGLITWLKNATEGVDQFVKEAQEYRRTVRLGTDPDYARAVQQAEYRIRMNASKAKSESEYAAISALWALKYAESSSNPVIAQDVLEKTMANVTGWQKRIMGYRVEYEGFKRNLGIKANEPEFREAETAVSGMLARLGSAIQKLQEDNEINYEKALKDNEAMLHIEEKWRKAEARRQKSIEQEQGNFEREMRYKYLELAGNGEQAQIERYINQLDDKYNSQFGRGLTDEEKSSFVAQKKLLMDLDRSSESLQTLFNGNALAETMQKGSLEVYRLQAKIKDPAREEQLKLARENADAAKRAAAAVEIMAQKTVGIQAANIGSVIGA